ncbi:hypothetical protein [Virgibacillus halodenitrificans]|uniref:hypothetical protein n=1 Tax=Virgibacillus halodenitrificans TaxID=1482 RepID=UPI0002EDA808|nr:hypothetical protein [Virgibacillus halodenitrificans]MYL60922.1 hypothetical protein [Virgibacillus halodenitrificans]
MRKLTKQEEAVLENLLEEGVFAIENKNYFITLVEAPAYLHETKKDDIKIETKKQTILQGDKFSIDDVIELMDAGAL